MCQGQMYPGFLLYHFENHPRPCPLSLASHLCFCTKQHYGKVGNEQKCLTHTYRCLVSIQKFSRAIPSYGEPCGARPSSIILVLKMSYRTTSLGSIDQDRPKHNFSLPRLRSTVVDISKESASLKGSRVQDWGSQTPPQHLSLTLAAVS